jgi:hypothetical protein
VSEFAGAASARLGGADAADGGGLEGASDPANISHSVITAVRELFPGRKRTADTAGLHTGVPFGDEVLRDDGQVHPEEQEAAEEYYGGVVAVECDWCGSWRFVVESFHGNKFTEREQTEQPVVFQCHQLEWKDGTNCGINCETKSQRFAPPNPNDPGEHPLAMAERELFLTWAKDYVDPQDFVVPESTSTEEDKNAFYREHYWRYLWFEHKIKPEACQTEGVFLAGRKPSAPKPAKIKPS